VSPPPTSPRHHRRRRRLFDTHALAPALLPLLCLSPCSCLRLAPPPSLPCRAAPSALPTPPKPPRRRRCLLRDRKHQSP
jgi:hypothetical protein